MIVRQFRPTGIRAFRSFLDTCREAPQTPVPLYLLEDKQLTEAIKPAIAVEPTHFATRRDAAVYLGDLLKPLTEPEIVANAGLWTWLTLFFFEELCPAVEGKHVVKKYYYYIF